MRNILKKNDNLDNSYLLTVGVNAEVQQFQMGQENGKTQLSSPESYFREQLAIYRWRADPSINSHLARVTFTSKHRLEGRQKLESLLQAQLHSHNYVTVQQLAQLAQQEVRGDEEEVMTFEQYQTSLEPLLGELTQEEMFYLLKVLLEATQNIFSRLGKTHLSSDCIFLTQWGELRVWINPNPLLNEPPENQQLQLTPSVAISQIFKICKQSVKERKQFSNFHLLYKEHLQQDILHHSGLPAIRKFLNGYIYQHRINVPHNLSRCLKKVSKSLSVHTPQNTLRTKHRPHPSSISQMIEPEPEWPSNFLSTGANLLRPKSSSYEVSSESESNRQIEFYRPNQPHKKLLSQLDLNCSRKILNRSDLVVKPSGQMSVSSSFYKKQQRLQVEVCNMVSPKNMSRTRTGLESTSGESYLGHSKDPSGFNVSRLGQSSSTTNFYEGKISTSKFERKPSGIDSTVNKTSVYPSTEQFHSKQPSFDENSSSLFVSPASEMIHYEATYRQPDLSKIETISQSSQSEHSNSGLKISTRGQVSPSQLLTRQVSALVENQQINLIESKGSFLSYEEGSISSDYKGVLMAMCRSAKILNIPTRKNIQKRNSRRHSKALHLNLN